MRAAAWLLGGAVAVTFVGKAIGFVREVLISSTYGTSFVADIFFAVSQAPALASSFMFGAYTIVFVPQWAAYREQGTTVAFLRSQIRTWSLIGLAATAAMLVGALVIGVLRIGVAPDGRAVAPEFTVILALSILPLVVTGLSYAVLHATGRHVAAMGLAALPPAIMLVALVAFLTTGAVDQFAALPVSFLVGAVGGGIVAMVQLVHALRAGRDEPAEGTGRGGSGPAPRFSGQLAASATENVAFSLNQTLTVAFAAGVMPGAVAVNAYAQRIAMLALSGVATPLSQVLQTRLAAGSRGRARLAPLLLTVGAVLVVVAVLLWFFAPFIVGFIYQRGAFSDTDADRVSGALRPYAAYFLVTAANQLAARYWFVRHEGWLYTRTMIAAYGVGTVLRLGVAPLGLEAILWAAVVGEALALVYFAFRIGRSRGS